ncbi:TonB-dependent receptor [Niveispirillum sp.]|uniref:TonB-dependent receptor n=1 Tax=Niveispirillum sp. TaxID=1917217 RepID=UPI001B7A65D2|nr:TonB-dependent receptor [Niveispirillum sp.]MBP7334475.1 TonB-dependent receptor [Niveispirillum sp.]
MTKFDKKLLTGAAFAALLLPALGAAQAQEAGQGAMLEEIIVTGVARSDGIKKLDASFSITTADAEAIAEQQPASTADLLKIVPGVWVESSSGTSGANIDVRGFPGGGDAPFITVQLDGSPLFPPPTLSFLENSTLFRLDDTVERVEVLRGGPSPIFSNGQPGATINFIQRKGKEDPEGSLKLTVGDEGLYRFDTYYQGALDKDLLFSVGGFYRTSDGIRDTEFPADRGGQVSGNITKVLENGEVTFYGRYTSDKNAFYTAIPLISSNNGKTIKEFPGFDAGTGTFLGNDLRNVVLEVTPGATPGTIRRDFADGRGVKAAVVGNTIDLTFGEWTVSNKMNYLKGQADTRGLFTGANPQTLGSFINDQITSANGNAAVVAAAGRTATAGSASFANGGGAITDLNTQVITAGLWSVDKDIESFTDDIRFSREIFDGNTITIGAYFADYSSKDLWYLGNNVLMTATPNAKLINLTLNNGAKVTRNGFVGTSFFDVNASYNGQNIAAFIADEWALTEDLRIDIGGRVEKQKVNATLENVSTMDLDGNPLTLSNNATSVLNGSFRTLDYSNTETSWTAGVNYYLTGDLSVFGRLNSGFKFPQFDNLRDGQDQMQKIDQQEIGLKTRTSDYAAYVTFFHNKFEGLPFQQFIINPDGSQTQLTRIGGSKAYGVEFELMVNPLENLNLALRGNYQKGEFKDFGPNSGNQVQRQPKIQFTFSPSYDVPMDWGKLRFFASYNYTGKRWADVENAQRLPSFDTIDAGISADIGDDVTVMLSGTNLTDELGLTEGNARIIGGANTSGVFMGRPIFGRNVKMSVATKF